MFEHLPHLDFFHLFDSSHHGFSTDEAAPGNGPDFFDPYAFEGQIRAFLTFDHLLEQKLQSAADPDGTLAMLHAKFHATLAEFQRSHPGAHRDILKARLDGIKANLSQRLGI